MKQRSNILVLFIFFLLFASCDGKSVSIVETVAQRTPDDISRTGFVFYVRGEFLSEDNIRIEIKDPQGRYTWNFDADEVQYNGLKYFGSSNLSMPEFADFPDGEWTASVFFENGETKEITFTL